MPLARLENFLKNLNGNTLYVDPNELDSSDSIENRGNSRTRPFKTIQRALIEAARFSYVPGSNNDLFDQTTILISSGTHYIDNRPGYYYNGSQVLDVNGAVRSIVQFSVGSNFDLEDSSNELYIYNSADGGVIIPKGVSLVANDLRKTKIRPKFVPDPANDNIARSSIFKVTGGSYIFGFSIYDGSSEGGVYNTYSDNLVNATYSHHKLTAFEYADGKNKYVKNGVTLPKTDLETYYYKLSLGFGSYSGRDIIDGFGNLQPNPEENKIVGDLGQGSINISDVIAGDGSTATTTVTVTTDTEHNFTPQTPIRITGVGLNLTQQQQFNGNFIVAQVIDPFKFTYTLSSVPSAADPALTSAKVNILSDTVSSSSPYIFNCSLKSVYGMNGLHADGSKATGFKSMVTAQFTGISLQRDDRAFLRYNSTTGSYDTQEDIGLTESLHQDSNSIYKPTWESFHIKASNDAFIQCVSIFAIGYAKQFVSDSGGDQSITNSNSNFGAISLISRGFKDYNLAKDNHAFITHIIPPKESTAELNNISCFNIDVGLTTSLRNSYSPNNTRIYLQDFKDQFNPPSSKIRNYTIGAKSADQIFVKFSSGESSATISPNYQVSFNIDSIDAANNVIGLEGPVSGLSVGNPVRIISKNAILPDGLEHNKVYYIKELPTSTSIKLSTDINGSNEVDIINNIGTEVEDNLVVVSRVSDTLPNNPGNPIAWDSTNNNWYLKISQNSAFINLLDSEGIDSPNFYIKRIIDTRVQDDKVYRARIVIPKESENASDLSSGFIIQKSSTPVDQNYSKDNETEISGDVFDLVRSNNNIIVDAWTTLSGGVRTANIVTRRHHNLKVGNKVNIYNLKSSSEPNPVGLGTGTGFNGSYVVSDVVDDLHFRYIISVNPGTIGTDTSSSVTSWLDQRNCNSQTRIPPYTIANTTDLPYFTCEKVNNDYQIYKIKTLQKYSQNVSDGIYHVYLNSFKNTPTDSNFNIEEYKLSQNIDYVYPEVDLDNVTSDVESSVSAASRQIIGKVDINDPKLSSTKETIISYLKDFNNSHQVSNITVQSGICTITTNNWHDFNAIKVLQVTSAGSGYVPGVYYDVPLCPTSGVTGEGATAIVTVNGSGVVSGIKISNSGSGYAIGDELSIKGIPGSTNVATATVDQLIGFGNNAIQVLGSFYSENNGVFPITSISGPKTITYANASGRSENPSSAVIIPIQTYPISSAVYSSEVTTITLPTSGISTQHPFLIGNSVYFNNSSTKFKVISADSPFTFKVEGDASGATSVYSSGLTSQINSTSAISENVSTRHFAIHDQFRSKVGSASNLSDISSTTTSIIITTTDGLNKGDFIQIDDEILLVRRISGASITVSRGCLGTRAASHKNGSLILRIKVQPIELRRNSIIRASGHTFEYTGFGPGNYSTGMPTNQDRVLSNDEILISQSLQTHGGLVVYTGMNSNGEFFIGRKKYDAVTGDEININEEFIDENVSFVDELTVNNLTVNEFIDASTTTSVFGDVTVEGDLIVEGDIVGDLQHSISTGNGLSGGTFDNSSDITVSLSTPGSLTSSSTNSAYVGGHTHQIVSVPSTALPPITQDNLSGIYGIKLWGVVSSGGVSINNGSGGWSVEKFDPGSGDTGRYRVTFSSPLPSSNYCVLAVVSDGGQDENDEFLTIKSKSSASFKVITRNPNGNRTNVSWSFAIIY